MKIITKVLLTVFVAGLLYFLITPLSQKILLLRLERGAEIEITGKNLSPFLLGAIHFKDLKISKKKSFQIRASRGRIKFSPLETLLGQAPLQIKANNLSLETNDNLINSFFSKATFDVLDAKIVVFSGKGILVQSCSIRGNGIMFEAKGKLVREGRGNSDLKATLRVSSPELLETFKSLNQNLFYKNQKSENLGKPLTFQFKLSGDLTHPLISLQSDLIRINVREKESVSNES